MTEEKTIQMTLPDRIVQGNATVAPMPFRTGTHKPNRRYLEKEIEKAAEYAFCRATERGQANKVAMSAIIDYFVIGLLGYKTPSGLSDTTEDNPNKTVPATKKNEACLNVKCSMGDDVYDMPGVKAIEVSADISKIRISTNTHADEIYVEAVPDTQQLTLAPRKDGKLLVDTLRNI